MGAKIIAIDDERDFLESINRAFLTSGLRNITLVDDPLEAAAIIGSGEVFDVALIDLTMPQIDGIELLDIIKQKSPSTECIMLTATNEARIAVDCIKRGAFDYLVKPITPKELTLKTRRALERKRLLDVLYLVKADATPTLNYPEAFKAIITISQQMSKILKEAELHAASEVPILITGESGTGKELLARAIHKASSRSKNRFIAVNMASLTGSLFDAEFFGHTKGAFTGADKDRFGYLETAQGGTLFLDEIGNLPLELQGKLLRVLQEGEYLKLGSSAPRHADIRFIAATNENLDVMLAQGKFRKDLYYRLKGAWLSLPPLRERKEDIPLLTKHFLSKISKSNREITIDKQAAEILLSYDYPGNIRELRSILYSAANLAGESTITPNHLSIRFKKETKKLQHQPSTRERPPRSLSEIEKEHILQLYIKTGRNKSKTAQLLGIGLNTLRRKLKSYGEK